MAIYPKLIMDALEKVRYPGTGKNIVEAGMVEDNIRIDGNKVSFSLIFPKETDPFIKSVVRSAEASLKAYVSKDLEVHITTRKAEAPKKQEPVLPDIKNIIAVSSGKGGVGKTTLTGLLIQYLCQSGKKPVLAVDADANSNLNEVLGVEAGTTLGELREEIERAGSDSRRGNEKGLSGGPAGRRPYRGG